jgi:ribosome-binding protein aMBF1 (putative translation factor)
MNRKRRPVPGPAGDAGVIAGHDTGHDAGHDAGASLPVMPGFREMALRRADEQAARMAKDRGRLVRELAEQRQAAGLSQTEIAARMGTSQSAVARLESGTADVRASTLERYAAAVGGQITWKLNRPGEGASE